MNYIELKASYFRQAQANILFALSERKEQDPLPLESPKLVTEEIET